jgi:hypothetical protein
VTKGKPFDFLADRSSVELLDARLRQIGLDVVSVTTDRISCSCAWLDEPVDLLWVRSWWPDGDAEEDRAVSVVHCGATVACCDVANLLRQKHAGPLATVVIDELVTACASLTGKAPAPR